MNHTHELRLFHFDVEQKDPFFWTVEAQGSKDECIDHLSTICKEAGFTNYNLLLTEGSYRIVDLEEEKRISIEAHASELYLCHLDNYNRLMKLINRFPADSYEWKHINAIMGKITELTKRAKGQ